MAYEKIRRALDAGIFDSELCEIVTPPTDEQIAHAESTLGVALNDELRQLLRAWGGSDLHEILIHDPAQLRRADGLIEFAADYSGTRFMADTADGTVHADDAHSGEIIYLAPSVAAFIDDFLLGAKGEDFYGEDWVRELKAHGLA
jgi:hypothetical protein